MIDFLIVGRGLAAMTLAHTFRKYGLSFKLIAKEELSLCSKVAAGIWNPVVFKRMTKSWLADDLLGELRNFYHGCEKDLNVHLITNRTIVKPFTEDQEKTLWKKKAQSELKGMIAPHIFEDLPAEYMQLTIPNGYSFVNNGGNLNVALFLEKTAVFFGDHLQHELFDHKALNIADQKIQYKNLTTRNIVFCEGFLVKDNPLFSWIPLKPAKGEVLTLKLPALQLQNDIFNRDGFLMRISEENFKLGATYAWDDLTQDPTQHGLHELQNKLVKMTDANYSLVKHEAGIRPSSLDRRPIIGQHPEHRNVFVFNGLGTKGVMLAPYFAKNFVHFYLQKTSLHHEVDIKRFYQLYGKTI